MIMPQACCRCNASDRCKNCSCKKLKKPCSNCLPQRLGKCENTTNPSIVSTPPNVRCGVSTSEEPQSKVVKAQSNGLDRNCTDAAAKSTPAVNQQSTPADASSAPPAAKSTPATASTTSTTQSEPSQTGNTSAQGGDAATTPTPPPEDLTPDLPSFTPISLSNFRWGDRDGEEFSSSLQECYQEIVHLKRNLFKVPTGKAGIFFKFVTELTRMIRAYADRSALESISLHGAMVMPALLLQKPHSRSKAKDHSVHLERRIQLWLEGDIAALMEEGRTIQHQLKHQKSARAPHQTARIFAKLMMEGKVRAAIRLISEESKGGLLNLNTQLQTDSASTDSVRNILLKKHPPRNKAKLSSIITPDNPPPEPHPIIFKKIDGELIRSTALRMEGAAGPSGLDTAAWKRLCTSFKTSSADLCNAIASLARRICSTYVDPTGLMPFVACRLIALDKCPGVRPIGIGETLRRIVNRAVVTALSDNIQHAAGPLQTCAGHMSGCEAAVHACMTFSNPPRQMQ